MADEKTILDIIAVRSQIAAMPADTAAKALDAVKAALASGQQPAAILDQVFGAIGSGARIFVTGDNPYDFELATDHVFFALTGEKIAALRDSIATLSPEAAAAAVQAIDQATKEKKSAKDILNIVFSIVGGVAKFAGI